MTAVRVLRLMEYTYPDQETADADMAHWSLPANGSYAGGARLTRPDGPDKAVHYMVRSSVIQQPLPDEHHLLNDCLATGCEVHAHLFSSPTKLPGIVAESLKTPESTPTTQDG